MWNTLIGEQYDIISDIHSCYYEFCSLADKLGYHNFQRANRKLVLVGDLLDKGPYPVLTFNLLKSLFYDRKILITRGNHDDKLMRWAKGNNVIQNHGLDKTIEELMNGGISKKDIYDFYNKLPYYLSLDNNNLIVVHASWKDHYIKINPFSKNIKRRCLYGPTTGELVNGLPVRTDWALKRIIKFDSPWIVHGHEYLEEVRTINKVTNIDTGCVYGGKLSALRYPSAQVVQENFQGR